MKSSTLLYIGVVWSWCNSYGPISPLVIGYGLIMLAESAWVNIRCTSIIQASSDNYAGIIHLLHTTWYMINAK